MTSRSGQLTLLTPAIAGVALVLASGHQATGETWARHGLPHATAVPFGTALQDAPPATSGDATTTTSVDDLTDEQRQQIDLAGPILLNPSTDIAHSTRLGAARQLLAMRVEPAFQVLREALDTTHPAIMAAVIEAVLESPRPVRALQDDLISALRTCPSTALATLGRAVRTFGSPAIAPIAALARDADLPTEQRLGPIFALSEFRSRAAALELMQLIDPGDRSITTDPPLFNAACDALNHMTGLSNGRDREAWSTWWRNVKDLPNEQWLEMLLSNLATRIDELQGQVASQQQYRQSIEQRLVEAHREILRSIASTEAQLQRIAQLLEDPLPAIRLVAVDRVGILLRDAVTIPQEFQATLTKRLEDASPEVRRRVVALLDQMNAATLIAEINGRLARETDTATAKAMVEILARRHTPPTLDGLLVAVERAPLRAMALQGLWDLLASHPEVISEKPEAMATLRGQLESLRVAEADDNAIAITRLWARIIPDDRLPEAIAALDDEDAAMRDAVAHALARRGVRQPLIQRAQDAAIFPHAVEVIASGPGDLPSFRILAAMVVPEGAAPGILHEGLVRLAGKLPITALLEADDVLQTMPGIPASVRIRTLERGVEHNGSDALDAASRQTLIVRLAALLLAEDAPVRAHQLLTQLNGSAEASTELTDLRFHAAIRSGAFEAAAVAGKPADVWIAELQRLAANADAVDLAKRLHADIMTRFAQDLTEAQLATLSGISQALAGGAASNPDDNDATGSQLPSTGQ